jgi:hypothetical protein
LSILDGYRACVQCSIWRATNTALQQATEGLAMPSVFLVSDNDPAYSLTKTFELFPTDMVSSPLQLPDNVPAMNSECIPVPDAAALR